MKILLIEDYQPLATSLKDGMKSKGFTIDLANDGEEGLWYTQNNSYDAIVLDLMLPKLDGLSVLKTLRREQNTTPVLILTAKGEVSDRVKGLNSGADDYLTKPFSFKEFLARIHALIRRSHRQVMNVIQVEDLTIDTFKHTIKRDGQKIQLTKKEYKILECLGMRKQTVVSKQDIMDNLYEFDDEVSSNVIEVHMMSLRRKIDHGFTMKLIHTVRGHGYYLGRAME